MLLCQICQREFNNYVSLANHLKVHHISSKAYFDKYLKKRSDGTCLTCGKPTSFRNLEQGYSKYCSSKCLLQNPNEKQKVIEKRKKTCLTKYGVAHPLQSATIKNKVKETLVKRYGVTSPLQSPEVKKKYRETSLKKYGVTWPTKHNIVQEKTQQTCLEKYGTSNVMQVPQFKQKLRETTLEKYGADHFLKTEKGKEKLKQNVNKKYGKNNISQLDWVKEKKVQTTEKHFNVDNPAKAPAVKRKIQTSLRQKYNVDNAMQVPEIKEKVKQTNIERYGTEHPMQNSQFLEKYQERIKSKYGVHSPLLVPEIRQKIQQTCLNKYGVYSTLLIPEVIEKIKQVRYNKFNKKLKKYLKELDLVLLDKKYVGYSFKHRWKCLKCETEFKQSWNAIQQGYTCPTCNPRPTGRSKQESEVADFIKKLGVDIIENDRQLIKPLELDIVIPDKKIAIEYNGLYWHNEEHVDKDYHLQKTELCKEKGYRLIHIFEDEWILKKDIVKSRLKHILGKTQDLIHIGARECTIKEISSREKNDFLEQFHIQGPDSSKIKLGAFYQDQLVAVMTFSHGSLAKGVKKQDSLVWELNRFCSHSDFVISGIASKLLEYFKKNYKWKEIFSYADRRWSDGNLYEKLGFDLDHKTQPNYWYVNNFQRIHRFALRKRLDEPKDIPEYILRLKEGYIRVWDCGNLKFVLAH